MAKLPIVPPFVNPIGLITDNGNVPSDYGAVWFQGTQAGAINFPVAPTDLIGVAGPATVAYLKAQGLAFNGTAPNPLFTLNPAEGNQGTAPTLSLTNPNPSNGLPTPTGQVQWFIDSTVGSPLFTTTLVGGQTSQVFLFSTFPSLGDHTIYANYLGDHNYLDFQASGVFDNQGAPVFDSLTINGFSSPHTFNNGNSLVFTATWTFDPSEAPIGNVQFYRFNFLGPSFLIGTSSGMSNVGGNNYAATITVTAGSGNVVTGTYFAVYEGDVFYISDNSSIHTGGNFAATINAG